MLYTNDYRSPFVVQSKAEGEINSLSITRIHSDQEIHSLVFST